MSHARTHQKRLARQLSRTTRAPLQQALQQVQAAAAAGRLPAVLDDAGMAAALAILTDAAKTGDDAELAPEDLHVEVRNALAAHPGAAPAGSTLLSLPTYDEVLGSGVGPLPLRRLYAFYGHAEARDCLDQAQVRADLAWAAEHLDAWVARQEQAQQDAREMLATLYANYPLPAVDDEQDPARAMLLRARAVRAAPEHWVHQPWTQRLMGRWTEDLPDAVAAARTWLAERSTQDVQDAPPSGAAQSPATDGTPGRRFRHPEPGPMRS